MVNLLSSRKLALVLPLIAIVYVAGLMLLSHHSASAYIVLYQRVENQVTWDSQFEDNQAQHGFPASTRHHIRQGMYQWDDLNTGADFDVDESTDDDAYVHSGNFSDLGYDNAPGVTVNLRNNAGRVWFSSITLNREWSWDDSSCTVDWNNEDADVRIVTIHESSHLIALDHDPSHTEAVTWPDGACKLTTVADDDNGVKDIYGNR